MCTFKHCWLGFLFTSLIAIIPQAFAFSDIDDNSATIDTFIGQGKWTVVEVWASDCRMCQLSIQHIVNFKTTHPAVDILGISVDGKEGKANAKAFIDEQHLTFPNLLSQKDEIDQYLFSTAGKNFIGTPTFLFYNPQGQLLTVQAKALTEKELGAFIDSQGEQQEIAEPC